MHPSSARTAPLVGPLVGFLVGIALSDQAGLQASRDLLIGVWLLTLPLLFLAVFRSKHQTSSRSIALILASLASGFLLHQGEQTQWDRFHFASLVTADLQDLKVSVDEVTRYGLVCNVLSIDSQPARGKVLLTSSTETGTLSARLDYMSLKIRLDSIPGPQNPHAFDFGAFCRLRGYSFQGDLNAAEKIAIGRVAMSSLTLLQHVAALREDLLKLLSDKLDSPEVVAVARAMLLGDRTALTRDIRSAYRESGLMHILAISGLHLGTVYLLLTMVLRRVFRASVRMRGLQSVIIIASLWVFYLLSGEAVSAGRAALMFTVLEIGKVIGSGKYSINALACAALVTLAISPSYLFDVGFQLSYLAVFGILLVQSRVESIVTVSNQVVRVIWKLFTLSFSAQLFTFPLLLYYFHEFSLLSLLTGILVVPLTAVVLQLGLLYFIFHTVPLISGVLLILLNAFIDIVNLVAQELPNILQIFLSGIYLPISSLIICYALAASVAYFLWQKQTRALLPLLVVLVLALCTWIHDRESNGQQAIFSIYFVEGKSYGSATFGQMAHIFDFDHVSAFEKRNSSWSNILHQRSKSSEYPLTAEMRQGIQEIRLGNSKCIVQMIPTLVTREADFFWICRGGAEAELSSVSQNSTIILDGSIPQNRADELERTLLDKNIKVYNLWKTGGINFSLNG